ncbi:endonuclease domain-containing protein [Pusillimonas sp.]|uniref:endonuclease domain-containing protein n=1 Tax=Pusillimonas sp. TaxID=3040095 RepID=UPI0037CAFB73
MLKAARLKQLALQGGKSPITGLPITDPVYDHCHKTGMLRAVLNRWENSILGRLENWANRLGGGVDPIAFLRGVADYIEFHQKYPSNILHPTYKTEAEKRDLRNKRAREARRKARESV